MIDNCPECGADTLVHDRHGVSYTYKNRHTTIPAVAAYHCTQCGGVTLDPAAVHRYDDLAGHFHRRVDGEQVEPAYVAAVRHKLRLDPNEAADVFGCTPHELRQYESGKAQPHPATVKLLQLLDRHPELLDELHG